MRQLDLAAAVYPGSRVTEAADAALRRAGSAATAWVAAAVGDPWPAKKAEVPAWPEERLEPMLRRPEVGVSGLKEIEISRRGKALELAGRRARDVVRVLYHPSRNKPERQQLEIQLHKAWNADPDDKPKSMSLYEIGELHELIDAYLTDFPRHPQRDLFESMLAAASRALGRDKVVRSYPGRYYLLWRDQTSPYPKEDYSFIANYGLLRHVRGMTILAEGDSYLLVSHERAVLERLVAERPGWTLLPWAETGQESRYWPPVGPHTGLSAAGRKTRGRRSPFGGVAGVYLPYARDTGTLDLP